MKNLFYLMLMTCICIFTAHPLTAQVQAPSASPTATLKQDVGLTDIEITYSRPGVKNRTIFGELVPYDQFWRTGANATTKVSFGDDVMIGGKQLKKGTYSLFTYPGEKEWTVIFSHAMNLPGADGYDKSNDAARIQIKPETLPHKVETFTIGVGNIRNNTATIDLSWENTRVSIPVSLNTDEKVFASIDQVMNGPSSGDYYTASGYYLATGKNLEQAHEWASKAVEMTDAKFPWFIYNKAQIEAELGKKDEAEKTAKQGISAAKAMGNDHYVMLHEKLIEKLNK
ncbi:DUF2911 domain-containing protein [Membranicola marinus]|uniref:DUF2911 domain-containing protein n=1 Tax=Membranihabitans marinus TaxID=1227546 RepID=A0A953HSS9_9BACT|nr:DUF2911 domain-containing protein [Membranihabitans marinus]MBY5957685.1 DUF2911 domain-containing protein [Membranihabitans marinus]